MWVLIDRVGHLAFYFLTKISGLNQASRVVQEVKHFSTAKNVDVQIEANPATISGWNMYGWTEDNTATTASISPAGTIRMNGDKTIYAVYRRDATFYSGLSRASTGTAQQFYNTTNRYSLTTPPLSTVTGVSDFTPVSWVTESNVAVSFGSNYTGNLNVFYAKYQRNAQFIHGLSTSTATQNVTQTYTSNNVYSLTAPAMPGNSIGNSWAPTNWIQKDTNAHVNGGGTYTGNRNVFYAYYTRSIIINYDANGGSGDAAFNSTTQSYDSSGAISPTGLALAENGYTRTGYNFSGWDLGQPGDTVGFAVGVENTKTAKAQWSGYTYTVTYKKGTASSGYDATTYADQTATYPTEITLHTNNMTKDDTTKPNSTITITFDANGGSVSNSSLTSTIPIMYTKNGWTTTEGSTTKNYSNGASYTNTTTDNSTLILYPCFLQDERARTSITMPTPTKTNYTCTGWFDGTGDSASRLYSPGVAYNTMTTSRTVYAKWTNKLVNCGDASTLHTIDGYSGNSSNSYTYKTIYKVKFELQAGTTWQSMADSDTYKYPVYLYCASSNWHVTSSIAGYTTLGEVYTLTTRAAVKSSAVKGPYLISATIPDRYTQSGTTSEGVKYTWSAGAQIPPTDKKVIGFYPGDAGEKNDGYQADGNLGMFGYSDTVDHCTRTSSSGNTHTAYYHRSPVLGTDTINESTIKKLYVISGSNTDINSPRTQGDIVAHALN